jgi:predicted transcriptional regulator
LKLLPLLEPLEPNKTDEVSYRNKSEIKEATKAQFNDLDEFKLIGMLSALNHQIPSSLPVLEQKQIIASGQT